MLVKNCTFTRVFEGQGSEVRSLHTGEPQAMDRESERQDGFSIIVESEPYMPEACLGKYD